MKILVALVLALAVAPAASAQSRRRPAPSPKPRVAEQGRPPRAQPAAPEAAPVVVPDDLSRLFPKDTVAYVELNDVGRALAVSGAEMLFGQFLAGVAGEVRSDDPLSAMLRSPELRTLLASTIVFASFPAAKENGDGAPGRPPARPFSEVAVLRMKTPALLAKAAPRVIAAFQPGLAKAKAVARVRAGASEIAVVAADASPSGQANAIAGRHLILGDLAGVKAVLGNIALPRDKALTTRADFATANSRMGERRTAFGSYLFPRDVPGPAADVNVGSSEEAELYRAWQAKTERFYGYSALRAVAFAVRAGEAGLSGKVLFDIEPDKPGLIPSMLKMPSIGLRAADFVPPEAELFWTAGIDLGRIYALVADPEAAGESFGHLFGMPGPEILPEVERTMAQAYGINIAHDVVGAFGDEVAVAKGTAPPAPGADGAPARFVVAVIEVRRPDALRRLIEKYNETLSADSRDRAARSEYRGAEVWTFGDRAWAMVDGFAVGGRVASVERALDAHATGASLASSPAFAQTVRSAPRETGAAFYATPRYAAAAAAGPGGIQLAEHMDKVLNGGGVSGFVTREAGAIIIEAEVRPAIFTAIALSAEGARPSSNESGAVGNLRTIGSAEATFYANTGRYGTMKELVETQMLDEDWTEPTPRDGYRFELTVVVDGERADEFAATAVPDRYGETGTKSFLISEDYVIREADREGGLATRDDPAVGMRPDHDWEYESPSAKALVPILDVLIALGSPSVRQNLTVEALFTLYTAQESYFSGRGRVGTVEELQESGSLDKGFSGFPERNGYRFEFKPVTGVGGKPDSFAITATPTAYADGALSFYLSPATGLRAADRGGRDATPEDPSFGGEVEIDEAEGDGEAGEGP